jgi:hypothetical protein
MNDDEHDQVWELLGKARSKPASPAFVRSVLRTLRMSEPAREVSFGEWLCNGWNWLALVGAAAVVVLVAVSTEHPRGDAPALASHDAKLIDEAVQSSDFSVVTDVHLLLALDDRNPWLDASQP